MGVGRNKAHFMPCPWGREASPYPNGQVELALYLHYISQLTWHLQWILNEIFYLCFLSPQDLRINHPEYSPIESSLEVKASETTEGKDYMANSPSHEEKRCLFSWTLGNAFTATEKVLWNQAHFFPLVLESKGRPELVRLQGTVLRCFSLHATRVYWCDYSEKEVICQKPAIILNRS